MWGIYFVIRWLKVVRLIKLYFYLFIVIYVIFFIIGRYVYL